MRTSDVYVGVGSSGRTVVVAEGEGRGVLVGELGLGADTSETPSSISSMTLRE